MHYLIKLFPQPYATAAAKSLQLCLTLCDPIDGSLPSLGFSRQEHWSGLPFPSPMHESEKWKWRCSVVSDPQRPHGLQPTRLLHPWDFPGRSTGVGCHCLLHTALTYSFSYLEPVCCFMSSSNCCFLTCIQVSQEAGQVVSYSHLFQNFPQFIVIHTVKGFGIVNKAEVDVFLELLLFWWFSGCWQFDLWFLCLS